MNFRFRLHQSENVKKKRCKIVLLQTPLKKIYTHPIGLHTEQRQFFTMNSENSTIFIEKSSMKKNQCKVAFIHLVVFYSLKECQSSRTLAVLPIVQPIRNQLIPPLRTKTYTILPLRKMIPSPRNPILPVGFQAAGNAALAPANYPR